MSNGTNRKCALAWDLLIAAAQRGTTITYGEMADEIGGIARGLGPVLKHIETRCRALGVPLLSALVVRINDRRPSSGYGGSSDLVDTYRAIRAHPWRSIENPFLQ